jgi:hypothetical protein
MKTILEKAKMITEADFKGSMLVQRDLSKKERKEIEDWAAADKVKMLNKNVKGKSQKTYS